MELRSLKVEIRRSSYESILTRCCWKRGANIERAPSIALASIEFVFQALLRLHTPRFERGNIGLELKAKKRRFWGCAAPLLHMRPPLDLACIKRTPRFRGMLTKEIQHQLLMSVQLEDGVVTLSVEMKVVWIILACPKSKGKAKPNSWLGLRFASIIFQFGIRSSFTNAFRSQTFP